MTRWRVVYALRSGAETRGVPWGFWHAVELLRSFEDAVALEHARTRFRIPRGFLSRKPHRPAR